MASRYKHSAAICSMATGIGWVEGNTLCTCTGDHCESQYLAVVWSGRVTDDIGPACTQAKPRADETSPILVRTLLDANLTAEAGSEEALQQTRTIKQVSAAVMAGSVDTVSARHFTTSDGFPYIPPSTERVVCAILLARDGAAP